MPAAEEAAREPEEAVLYLHSSCWERLRYLQTWTVGKWQDGEFVTLHYEDRVWREPVERLGLEPGIYRVITANRMPNGSQQSEEITLCLQAGEEAHVTMALKEGAMEDMLVGSAIEDFILMDESGAGHELSRILKGEGGVLAFLEEGAEPTEHILNEWRAAADSWNKAEIPLIWVVRSRQALENPTLQKTRGMLRKLRIYFDPDWENAEPMARKMYVNPEGLPLAVLVGRGLRGMYGSSGYNVGSVELIYKLWKETGQERHGKKEKDT